MGNSATRNANDPRSVCDGNLVHRAGRRAAGTGGQHKKSGTEASAARSSDSRELISSKNSQNFRQNSAWSLGSLSERLNWSFTGTTRSSFRNRNKASRKSLNSTQQRRSKTVWHKPLTNAIFSSHFKETSRNEQFLIDRLVAKGAFGVVFKVVDKKASNGNSKQQATYALKVLKKSKIIEENSLQQIKDEADIQKLCGHHQYIVQQFDLWQNRRNLHILSEYVPNGELFSKISSFTTDLIRIYLAEIALAIDFLHNAGIIYRDAKPENILLTHDYHIKITDFGLSKWLKLGATTKTMCGTFQYMAPEILQGEAYGHAVDWWSLGIIVCQMYTDRSPNISKYLNISLPSVLATEADMVAHKDEFHATADKVGAPADQSSLFSAIYFLPEEVENLPHEGQDVLKRLLIINPKLRIHSVLALQRVALYKNFKIDAKHLQNICPLNIIEKDNIPLYSEDLDKTYSSSHLASKEFDCF